VFPVKKSVFCKKRVEVKYTISTSAESMVRSNDNRLKSRVSLEQSSECEVKTLIDPSDDTPEAFRKFR